jgi:hypothetical protein
MRTTRGALPRALSVVAVALALVAPQGATAAPSTGAGGKPSPVARTAGTAGPWCVRDQNGVVKVPSNSDLPNWDSPYLGHNGNWDGRGGNADGTSKAPQIANEKQMGLHWTFMPVYWSAFEPNGPTSPSRGETHDAWQELDEFVVLAHQQHMNVLFQAPVVGGNAGGPPAWAGTRVSGSSAPADMGALERFTAKLVTRYMPCGSLAHDKHWTDGFGVRAWEFDNEPYSYSVNWGAIPDDYAEAFTRVSRTLHRVDPNALMVSLALNDPDSDGAKKFVHAILDKGVQGASPQYVKNKVEYAVGPYMDVVSFHAYEFLDRLWHQGDGDITLVDHQSAVIRGLVNDPKYLRQKPFTYSPRTEFWHTEGGYDFLGFEPIPLARKENWVIQFLARGFGAGVGKLTLQDVDQAPAIIDSVHTFTSTVTDPHTLREVTRALGYDPGTVRIFRGRQAGTGDWVYIAWAANQTAVTSVQLPVRGAATLVSRSGTRTKANVTGGKVDVQLTGLTPFSEPVFVVESRS